jgi:NDP-sugar pyrophosphorylase family protein
MQAMILAAGYGTRLQPYTDHRPKPLFPLLNIPLLQLTIERLQVAGFDHIVVNCHHLRSQIKKLLSGIPGITLQEESSILGTGGGLRYACEKLLDEPLLITNGDIYHTIDFVQLYEKHLQTNCPVSLAVHDYPRFNTLLVEGERILGFDHKSNPDALAFTGVHVIDPDILHGIAKGKKSCIIERYQQMLQSNEEIAAIRVDGQYWTDIGTPADYLDLHRGLLTREIPCWQEINDSCLTPFYIDEKATLGNNVNTIDWVCIGEAQIGNNVTISRSVIWDGAKIPDNIQINDSIIVG